MEAMTGEVRGVRFTKEDRVDVDDREFIVFRRADYLASRLAVERYIEEVDALVLPTGSTVLVLGGV